MEHFYDGIDGWTQFEDIYREAVVGALDGAVFAEVGCWKGRSAAYMGVEILNSCYVGHGEARRRDMHACWRVQL